MDLKIHEDNEPLPTGAPAPPRAGEAVVSASPPLPFALPEIGEEEIAEVVEALRSGWITTGPKAKRFEEDFAGAIGGGVEAVSCNSATAGLHLALEALGIGPGDQVLTTPYTFTATAEVVRYLGADPVFADIDPRTFNLDPHAAAGVAARCPRLKALLPVHVAGQCCDMAALGALARERGVPVVEDAAHSFPATFAGRPVGTLSEITVFSFYATKTITTGEGGMVVSRDRNVLQRIRTMRLHGIDRNVFDRYTSTAPRWYYEVIAPGFKYNMPDIAAAMGIAQLRKAQRFLARRAAIARMYSAALAGLPLRIPAVTRPQDIHSWHLYVILLELEALTIERARFIELMAEQGIGCSVHFIPLHLQPYWRDRYHLRPESFPAALDTYQRAVSLPIYTRMSDADVERVIRAVRSIATRFAR
jgi:dTDP-4-amino-4,6-dideoxygalactose transaminase